MENIILRNAKLIFRNFEGKKSDFNKEGARNFSVMLNEDIANELREKGFHIKPLKKPSEDEEQMYSMKVNVRFDNYPPTIYMIVGNKKTSLNELTVKILDTAIITKADLEINPSHWTRRTGNGEESGVSAYCTTLYCTIKEDVFADEYRDYVEDSDEEVPFN